MTIAPVISAENPRQNITAQHLIQHLSILDTSVYLRITPKRYICEDCDDNPTTTEQYNWCDRNASVTKGLEEYLLRRVINSTIEDAAKKERISYKQIQLMINRQVNTEVNWDNIPALETLGIDEIALKKGHSDYVTVISGKSKEGELFVLSILEGREKETTQRFLETIPERVTQSISCKSQNLI